MTTEYLNISRRVGLVDILKEKGFKIGVEIGTDRGGYAEDICKRYPEFELYTCDPYLPYNEGKEVKTQEDMNHFRDEARELLGNYPNCTFIPGQTSKQLAEVFKDNSIDFVFIDGNHEYEGVKEDIELWYPKIKKGGIVSGHDYVERPDLKYGVVQAVDEFVRKNDIYLYVLKRGTFVPCFMFYKI